MFAMRLKRYVLQQDEFVITANFLKLTTQVLRGIFSIALAIFFPRTRYALGRIDQSLARRIIACTADQCPDGILHMVGHGQLAQPSLIIVVDIVAGKTAHDSRLRLFLAERAWTALAEPGFWRRK